MLTLTLITLGVCLFLLVVYPGQPATANEPAPIPATDSTEPSAQQGHLLCSLEVGQSCEMLNALDIAASHSRIWTYPRLNARDVPTYTLVSITFTGPMDPATISTDTFYLKQDATQVAGEVQYFDAGKMAVFFPETPLQPNTSYTATATTGMRDSLGVPLPEDIVWTFTTLPGQPSPLGNQLVFAEGVSGSAMNIYFGDLHGHTSYSDGQGFPANAFTMARASGLDFYGLTEHAFMMDATEWQDVLRQANAFTINGQFVALPGFEYTHAKGHINVFGSDTYIHRNDPNYDTLNEFYNWLIAHPTALGQFNHPSNLEDTNFNDFLFHPAADQKMVLQELLTADQFFQSLNKGWHLGTLKNRDTHMANWGCCPLMGLLAPNLTPQAILEALRARRTFFVSPHDPNLAVMMQANGFWMGSAIPHKSVINFAITAHDPNPTGQPLYLTLYDNGVPVTSVALPSSVWYSWTPTVAARLGHYYYVGAYRPGWYYPAYSSPIWVERPPLAQIDVPPFVGTGKTITLNGSSSWDPDGDVLAYQWAQVAGQAVALSNITDAQPAFVAPATPGQLSFRLTVVDTGGLSHAKNATVTVTNQPILSITKQGPATTQPGELIAYKLTVTNNGVSDAIGVVVTDTLPAGATYIDGGTLVGGKIISWTFPTVAANGGAAQVEFVVSASGMLINRDYGASCAGCIPAVGSQAIVTNARIYLPVIQKSK